MGEKAGERRIERQPGCWWLFFKQAFLVDQSKGSTEQLWNGILHFSFSFCGECFALRSSSGAEFGLMLCCWMQALFFSHTILVSSCSVVECGYKSLNLKFDMLTLNAFFETWKYCTACMNALECIKGRVKGEIWKDKNKITNQKRLNFLRKMEVCLLMLKTAGAECKI